MTSLHQLLAAHAPVLLLDAASTCIQVGWLARDTPDRWQTSEVEAGLGVFTCVEALGIDVGEAGAFVFCEGPGSVLGIRTTAMAIRTWNVLKPRPVFAYSSVAVVAEAIGRSEVAVIVDARRESWHCYQLGAALRRVAAADLPAGAELVTPEHFRHWSPLPAGVARAPYRLSEVLPRIAEAGLFRPTDSPDAFQHDEPGYVTWTPRVHRAPTAK